MAKKWWRGGKHINDATTVFTRQLLTFAFSGDRWFLYVSYRLGRLVRGLYLVVGPSFPIRKFPYTRYVVYFR